MRSRARVAGHAVHPMLIVFPLGLLSTAVVFDVIHLFSDNTNFAVAAAYAMAAGLISAPFAAATGWADWWKIPAGTRAKSIGLFHGVGNGVVILLFLVSWLLRLGERGWEPPVVAIVLGLAGFALAGVTGWLGGELVERLGVSVEDDANLDAPSSLTHAVR